MDQLTGAESERWLRILIDEGRGGQQNRGRERRPGGAPDACGRGVSDGKQGLRESRIRRKTSVLNNWNHR
jgi:hypothetical protein